MHQFGLEDNQKSTYVVRVGIAFGIIDTVAVLLRLIARWRSNAAFAADDWWIVWSLVPLCSMVAVGTLSMLFCLPAGSMITTLNLTQWQPSEGWG